MNPSNGFEAHITFNTLDLGSKNDQPFTLNTDPNYKNSFANAAKNKKASQEQQEKFSRLFNDKVVINNSK
ncbi:MAG TPA: hypothetical protein VGP47_05850 [Parachlamydiaceae bacterium]|nr:hypothetical protein [Parachlamydiaceae bacterium]